MEKMEPRRPYNSRYHHTCLSLGTPVGTLPRWDREQRVAALGGPGNTVNPDRQERDCGAYALVDSNLFPLQSLLPYLRARIATEAAATRTLVSNEEDLLSPRLVARPMNLRLGDQFRSAFLRVCSGRLNGVGRSGYGDLVPSVVAVVL